jgi:hypothetical protein
MASDTITILTDTNGRFATKQFQRLANGEWHVTGYSNMSRFRWREETIDGIHSLAEVLKAVSTEASSFPIRGRIHDDQRDNEIVRRRLDTFGGRRGETPHSWTMLDFDGVQLPPGLDMVEDPEQCVEGLIGQHLPAEFQDTTLWWQLSSSCGVRDTTTLKTHLWFWLHRPVSGGDLSDYLDVHAPEVDLCVLRNDTQPHYTAAPIFQNTPDPLPVRQSLMEREHDFVTLPEIDTAALRLEAVAAGRGSALLANAEGFEAKLALLGDGPGLASFHKPIRDAIFDHLYGCLVLPRDFEPIKGKIRAAVIAAPKRSDRQKDVARYCSDAYLDETIAGAIRRTRGRTIAIRTAGDGQGLANDASAETDAIDLEEAGRRLEAEVDAFFEAAP